MKETYFIPYSELEGSAFFEFQKGEFNKKLGFFKRAKMEFKLTDSLFLDSDDGATLMEVFSFFLPGFDLCYIGYHIRKPHGIIFGNELRRLAALIESGSGILESLETMGVYDPKSAESIEQISYATNIPSERISRFEDRYKELILPKVQQSAKDLALWLDEAYSTHETVSLLGL